MLFLVKHKASASVPPSLPVPSPIRDRLHLARMTDCSGFIYHCVDGVLEWSLAAFPLCLSDNDGLCAELSTLCSYFISFLFVLIWSSAVVASSYIISIYLSHLADDENIRIHWLENLLWLSPCFLFLRPLVEGLSCLCLCCVKIRWDLLCYKIPVNSVSAAAFHMLPVEY